MATAPSLFLSLLFVTGHFLFQAMAVVTARSLFLCLLFVTCHFLLQAMAVVEAIHPYCISKKSFPFLNCETIPSSTQISRLQGALYFNFYYLLPVISRCRLWLLSQHGLYFYVYYLLPVIFGCRLWLL